MRPEPVEGQTVRFDRRRPELGRMAQRIRRNSDYLSYLVALMLNGRQARLAPAVPSDAVGKA
jgi:hypothetical protein